MTETDQGKEESEGVFDAPRSGAERLMPMLYDELRKLASDRMRRERRGQTLQTTALVHEAYLKLREHERLDALTEEEFLALAACTMRRILEIGRAHV